jgi:hypothetical protein
MVVQMVAMLIELKVDVMAGRKVGKLVDYWAN